MIVFNDLHIHSISLIRCYFLLFSATFDVNVNQTAVSSLQVQKDLGGGVRGASAGPREEPPLVAHQHTRGSGRRPGRPGADRELRPGPGAPLAPGPPGRGRPDCAVKGKGEEALRRRAVSPLEEVVFCVFM